MTATKETASSLPAVKSSTRYVLLVVTAKSRSDQRLDVVEFRTKAAVMKALKHLEKYSQFDVCIADDSVPA